MEIQIKRHRLDNTTIACPIVYGSVAHWLGKKADESATHKWTIFLRGPNDEDLSTFVSHVAFSLHPSFTESIRIIDRAPYEVTEAGWGEFEVGIRIFFRDPDEQPIDLQHQLKLYHPAPQPLSLKKPVVSEEYDEIVFTSPFEDFGNCLMQYSRTRTLGPNSGSTASTHHHTTFDDENNLQQLTVISDHLAKAIESAKLRLLQLDAEAHKLHEVTGAFSVAPTPLPLLLPTGAPIAPKKAVDRGSVKSKASKDTGDSEKKSATDKESGATSKALKSAAEDTKEKEKSAKESSTTNSSRKSAAAAAAAAAMAAATALSASASLSTVDSTDLRQGTSSSSSIGVSIAAAAAAAAAAAVFSSSGAGGGSLKTDKKAKSSISKTGMEKSEKKRDRDSLGGKDSKAKKDGKKPKLS